MSRPVGVQQVGPLVARTGVMLALAPTSDPTLRMQVRSAVGSSTGTFTTFPDLAGQWGPGQRPTFTDVLPLDGVTRVYQTRAVRNDGTVVGAWSPSLKAKPGVLPEGGTVQGQVSGHKIGSHISISTGVKLQLGSGNVARTYAKSAIYPAALLVPKTQTTKWGYSSAGYLWPNTTTGTQTFIAPVYLATGITLGVMTLWGAKLHTGSIVKAVLTGTDFTESTVTYCTLTLTTAADTVTSTSADGVQIVIGNRYNWTVTLKTTGGSSDGQFKLLTMAYRMPDYAKSL